ncbi:MAG TPA: HlyD family secretion protein [Candidatus Baltobacteraceae bacterium]|nr:HlyD family secretion protein [Candidatus Baltobacteraceae bacterium]
MATDTISPPKGVAIPERENEGESASGSSRRTLLIGAGIIVGLVVLVFALRWLLYALSHETTDDAKLDTDQVTLTSKISERVRSVLVDTNSYVRKGQPLIELDSQDEQTRLTQAAAAVRSAEAQARSAHENALYVADQQAAQNMQNQASISQASATALSAADEAQSSQSQIAVAQAGVDAAKSQLAAAQSDVPAAAENLRRTRLDLARAQSLVSTGDVARTQLDAARSNNAAAQSTYDSALQNVLNAQANLVSAQQKLDSQRAVAASSTSQTGAAEAAILVAQGKLAESSAPSRVPAQRASANAVSAQAAQARAQMQTAQDQLSYTRIYAPVDGYIGEKYVEVGQTVAPGTALMAVIPANDVYVTANYKETQLGKIKVGQPVEITIDAYKGVTFTGRVETISPASQNTFSLIPPQNATGNFVKVTQRVPVRIMIEPKKGYPLRPGLSVETSIAIR